MKKVILYFALMILMLGFTSCSKDDNNVDAIIGTWQLTSGNDECENKSTIIFNEDGTGVGTSYDNTTNDENEQKCVSEIVQFDWSKTDNNQYTITNKNNIKDVFINTVILTDNNNKMTVGRSDFVDSYVRK